MSYESNPAGLGVGKTYGARATGGIDGQVRTAGVEKQIVFELSAGTISDVYSSKIIQDGYLVSELVLDVEEAFAVGAAANISINGGAGLTTPLDLATLGISAPALTGATNTSGSGPIDVVLTPDAEALASSVGKARLVVKYQTA